MIRGKGWEACAPLPTLKRFLPSLYLRKKLEFVALKQKIYSKPLGLKLKKHV